MLDRHDCIFGNETAILKIGINLIESLESLHAAGYAHNDIKPDNVTIGIPGDSQDTRARLIDFGVSEKLTTDDSSYK